MPTLIFSLLLRVSMVLCHDDYRQGKSWGQDKDSTARSPDRLAGLSRLKEPSSLA